MHTHTYRNQPQVICSNCQYWWILFSPSAKWNCQTHDTSHHGFFSEFEIFWMLSNAMWSIWRKI